MGIQRDRERLIEVAAQFLQDGENSEMASIAFVGSLGVKRSAAIAAATTILTAGAATGFLRPVKQFVLLTNKRLLMLPQHPMSAKPIAEISGEVPRSAMKLASSKIGMMMSNIVLDLSDGTALKIRFPLNVKSDAKLMIELMSK